MKQKQMLMFMLCVKLINIQLNSESNKNVPKIERIECQPLTTSRHATRRRPPELHILSQQLNSSTAPLIAGNYNRSDLIFKTLIVTQAFDCYAPFL